jgi:hypothetical protein
MSREYIDIASCPLCKVGHRYELEVERSVVWKLTSTEGMDEHRQKVRLTRQFRCPSKNEEFEWSFELMDSPTSKVKSVIVKGVLIGDSAY